jgi:septal ring factor EnvC (AmiA/AmiB activator)
MTGEFLAALIALIVAAVAGLGWLFKQAGQIKVLQSQQDDLKKKVEEQDTLVRDVTTQLAIIETKLANTDEKLDLIRTEISDLKSVILETRAKK